MAEENKCSFKTSIGGQALFEGLLMIGPRKRAMAVRKPDGEIVLEYFPSQKKWLVESWPLVRGSVKLVRQLSFGMKAIFRSAELSEVGEEDEKESKPSDPEMTAHDQNDPVLPAESYKAESEKKEDFATRHPNMFMGIMTVISLGISILLFGLLPNWITDIIRRLFHLQDPLSYGWQVGLNLIEGLVRIVIFISYLAMMKMSKQMKRIIMYHGAEHKTIACYEAKEDLTVENVRKFSRLHPRCGTSFLFLVVIISIIVLSFTGWHSPLVNVALRLLLLPLIAGLSYELILWTGRYDNAVSRALRKPGLALQNFTTEEPEDDMLEVSITAMEAVIPEDDSDRW